ncbi:histidine kinase [Curtobacterium sp. ISL-83]|uniref:sensor histidine kinase n=1 Tax=Curtobacterium sp. ISL-83 TaxID=2819145 RepID=UPI001BE9C6F2|nr:histidine kinase [Curtobacterium sp. ISL-83]MBT2501990.1 two-component sensor histidine kinase [Curtobacterium sp. ISL-83]
MTQPLHPVPGEPAPFAPGPGERARTDLPPAHTGEGGLSRPGLSRALNALGIVVVAFWFARNGLALHHPAWVWVLGAVALAAWVVRETSRSTRVVRSAAAVMILAGAAVVVPTESLMIVPVILGIVLLGTDLRLPVWTATVAAVVAIVVIAVVATVMHTSVQFVLGTGGGVLLGVLIGFSRRQFRLTEEQARRSEREEQRAELLASRARAARDVHDVLAHSLGGLVLQLDAVEALLEAGRVDEATTRAAEARTLAAEGLSEARRAVRTLRDDPPTPADVADAGRASRPAAALAALVDAHRSFGGEVTVRGDEALADLDAAHRDAVVAVSREALSNARRHAPGRPVVVSVVRDGSAVRVTVTNPLASDGRGVVGMRERFAELHDTSTVDASVVDGSFVVSMSLPVVTP